MQASSEYLTFAVPATAVTHAPAGPAKAVSATYDDYVLSSANTVLNADFIHAATATTGIGPPAAGYAITVLWKGYTCFHRLPGQRKTESFDP